MANPLAVVGLALLGSASAALVNWGADVLPPAKESEYAAPVAESNLSPTESRGALRLDRRLWVLLAGLLGGAAVGYRFGVTATGLWVLGWGELFLLITAIDFEHRLVLNKVLLAAAAVSLAASMVGLVGAVSLKGALLGGAAGLALFLFIALVGRGAMGLGDVKLAGFIGLLLGFPAVFSALLLGVVFGGVAALGAILMGKGRKSTIAYAPWLSLGALVTLVQAAT